MLHRVLLILVNHVYNRSYVDLKTKKIKTAHIEFKANSLVVYRSRVISFYSLPGKHDFVRNSDREKLLCNVSFSLKITVLVQ